MAEKKTTTTRTNAKKAVETTNNNNNNNDELIKQLMKQIELQNEQMAKMQKEIENAKNSQIVVQGNNALSGKKIKVINLMHNPLNVSTEPNGLGRNYNFNAYGDHKMIKFDDLSDIVSSYPYTMEHGFLYIADNNAVEALGLSEEYENIYSKEIMDELVYLREEHFVDMFLGMAKKLQESTAIEIARLINANETMDYNYLRKIKDKAGIDIEHIANEIKKEMSNPSDNLVE